jgi:hypothetical protein
MFMSLKRGSRQGTNALLLIIFLLKAIVTLKFDYISMLTVKIDEASLLFL